MRLDSIRLLLLVGVLLSLCFSSGEGMRLLPLPGLVLSSDEAEGQHAHVTPSRTTVTPKGPGHITMPAKTQKRVGRQLEQNGIPIAPYVYPVPAAQHCFIRSEEVFKSASSRFVSRPPGRAPPRPS